MVANEPGRRAASGRPTRWILALAALFIVAYFASLFASNVLTTIRLSNEEAALRAEIAALERREARLRALKSYMESDAFLEAAAREHGYTRPGETAVVVTGGSSEPARMRPGDPWWARYLTEADRR